MTAAAQCQIAQKATVGEFNTQLQRWQALVKGLSGEDGAERHGRRTAGTQGGVFGFTPGRGYGGQSCDASMWCG